MDFFIKKSKYFDGGKFPLTFGNICGRQCKEYDKCQSCCQCCHKNNDTVDQSKGFGKFIPHRLYTVTGYHITLPGKLVCISNRICTGIRQMSQNGICCIGTTSNQCLIATLSDVNSISQIVADNTTDREVTFFQITVLDM